MNITLFTGTVIDLENFEDTECDINIIDIINSLHNEKRWFNVNLSHYPDILTHSYNVYRLMTSDNNKSHLSEFFGIVYLTHDFAEAIISDIPRPIKSMCPEIGELEQRLEKWMMPKFTGLDYPVIQAQHEMLKDYDIAIAIIELKKYGGMSNDEIGRYVDSRYINKNIERLINIREFELHNTITIPEFIKHYSFEHQLANGTIPVKAIGQYYTGLI